MISFEDRTARIHQLFGMADKISTAEMNIIIEEIVSSYKITVANIKSQLAEVFEKYSIDGALTRQAMNKYGRLIKLEKEIAEAMHKLTGETIKLTKSSIVNIMNSEYYSAGAIVQNGYDLALNLPLLSTDILNANIQNSMSLIKWDASEKIWSDKYIFDIRNHINSGINQGWGYSQIANNITHSGILTRNRIARIVRTETHRAQSIARNISMEDSKAAANRLGIAMEKFWISDLLPTTRDAHSELDGKVADEHGVFHVQGMTTEYPGGFGIAGQDINCHCTIEQRIPELDREYKRRLKNLDGTGYKEFGYNNLQDWEEIKRLRMIELEAA